MVVNFGELLVKPLRRWMVVVPICILAVVAGVMGARSTQVVYESTASVIVIPPGSGSPVATDNPLINLNDNIVQLAFLLAGTLNSASAAQRVADVAPSASYEVSNASGDNATFGGLSPQIVISVRADSAEAASEAAAALVGFAGAELARIQANAYVPPRNNALTVTTAEPSAGAPLRDGGRQVIKAAAGYSVAVLVAGWILLLLIEGFAQSRSRRTRTRSHDALRTPDSAVPPGPVKADSRHRVQPNARRDAVAASRRLDARANAEK